MTPPMHDDDFVNPHPLSAWEEVGAVKVPAWPYVPGLRRGEEHTAPAGSKWAIQATDNVPEPPHECRTCAQWHTEHPMDAAAPCYYLTNLDGGTLNEQLVWTPAEFGCNCWREREEAR